MNYIGSKLKLSKFILFEIRKKIKSFSNLTFAEIFAGTGIISRKLKTEVKKVIANDFEYYSYVLLKNYIGNHTTLNYNDIVEHLNNVPGKEGKIFKNYCIGGGNERNFFSDENGKKIDAIRQEIEYLKNKNEFNENEYFFALASLLEAADKVANTASVYGAFLKHIKKSAQKPIILEPAYFPINDSEHLVYNEEANALIKKISGDILYLDPPYNHRQYGANYHLLNTIALYDDFEPRGKTGLRDYNKSDYCIKSKAYNTFKDLIENADFHYIFLSYNNEGILSLNEINEIFSSNGSYEIVVYDSYLRFKADRDTNRKYSATHTKEYLHILKK